MGSYAGFEHYLTTLEVETCPEFWPPSPVSGPLCVPLSNRSGRARRSAGPQRALPRSLEGGPSRQAREFGGLAYPALVMRRTVDMPETGAGGQNYGRVSTSRVVK